MADETKRTWRRLFRFKLSTWFVLVGILGWAMATRPYRIADNRVAVPYLNMMRPDFAWPTRINPRLAYPVIALVAFLAGKGFWLLRERRQQRRPAKTQAA